MNAIPSSMIPPTTLGVASRPAFGQSAASGSSRKWAALQDAARVIAALAGIEPERPTPEIRNFPALMREAEPWRRELAERGIEDMTAVLEPGITALLGVNARGASPRPAALALWREFIDARAAVLALLPPSGALGPRRSA
jgi:hypothetical protein